MKAIQRDDLQAYVFHGKDRAVAVAWSAADQQLRSSVSTITPLLRTGLSLLLSTPTAT